jgi:hypothetical protein
MIKGRIDRPTITSRRDHAENRYLKLKMTRMICWIRRSRNGWSAGYGGS